MCVKKNKKKNTPNHYKHPSDFPPVVFHLFTPSSRYSVRSCGLVRFFFIFLDWSFGRVRRGSEKERERAYIMCIRNEGEFVCRSAGGLFRLWPRTRPRSFSLYRDAGSRTSLSAELIDVFFFSFLDRQYTTRASIFSPSCPEYFLPERNFSDFIMWTTESSSIIRAEFVLA